MKEETREEKLPLGWHIAALQRWTTAEVMRQIPVCTRVLSEGLLGIAAAGCPNPVWMRKEEEKNVGSTPVQ